MGRIWADFKDTVEDERKSRIKARCHQRRLLPVTTARSAGSFRSFRGRWKWGQNRRGNRTLRSLSPNAYSHKEKTGVKPRKGGHDEQKRKISPLPVAGEKSHSGTAVTKDGSRSLTAFIENAIDFYLDYLSANNAGLFLPTSVQSYLDGRLDQFENRMASLLFKQAVELDKAMSELEHYTGNVWTHIISLHWEDAERLGYNNAKAWRSLLRTHRNDIAAAMKIPPQNFRWYAAFHDEGKHPHVHMMAWSVKPG